MLLMIHLISIDIASYFLLIICHFITLHYHYYHNYYYEWGLFVTDVHLKHIIISSYVIILSLTP